MLTFSKFFEATSTDLKKIEYALNNTDDRPFEELFIGKNDRELIKIPTSDYLDELAFHGLTEDDVSEREIKGININKWFKSNSETNILKQIIGQRNNYYYLVMSRNPIDVLRMADHRDLSSCHNLKSGSFKDCAFDEAQNSGAIIYFISENDFNTIKKTDYNKGEIFKDPDRNIDGIEPTKRVRIRRFVDMLTGDEYGIPELRFYERNGNVSGLTRGSYVRDIAKLLRDRQPRLMSQSVTGDYIAKNMVMVGGSYSDSSYKELLSSFFNKKIETKFSKDDPIHPSKLDPTLVPRGEDNLKLRRILTVNPQKAKGSDSDLIRSIGLNIKDGYTNPMDLLGDDYRMIKRQLKDKFYNLLMNVMDAETEEYIMRNPSILNYKILDTSKLKELIISFKDRTNLDYVWKELIHRMGRDEDYSIYTFIQNNRPNFEIDYDLLIQDVKAATYVLPFVDFNKLLQACGRFGSARNMAGALFDRVEEWNISSYIKNIPVPNDGGKLETIASYLKLDPVVLLSILSNLNEARAGDWLFWMLLGTDFIDIENIDRILSTTNPKLQHTILHVGLNYVPILSRFEVYLNLARRDLIKYFSFFYDVNKVNDKDVEYHIAKRLTDEEIILLYKEYKDQSNWFGRLMSRHPDILQRMETLQ